MRSYIKIILVVLATSSMGFKSNAQELFVIAGAGNYSQGALHNVSWTMGEPVTTTMIFPSHHITQGFHQSDLKVIGIVTLEPMNVSVYPNPADDIINITSSENSKLSIFDIQGKLIETVDITSTTAQVDVSYLSRGTYTLVFEASATLAKRMKIVIL